MKEKFSHICCNSNEQENFCSFTCLTF